MWYFRARLTGNKIIHFCMWAGLHMHLSTNQSITVQIMYQYKRARENVAINDGVFLENRLSVFATVSPGGRRARLFLLPACPHLFSTQRKQEAAIGTNPNLSCLDLEGLNIPAGQPLLHTSWETGEEKMLRCFFWNHTKTTAAHIFCIKMSSWHGVLN